MGEYESLPDMEESSDWVYKMRRSMQEILPGLYLGPYSAAKKTEVCIPHTGADNLGLLSPMLPKKVF